MPEILNLYQIFAISNSRLINVICLNFDYGVIYTYDFKISKKLPDISGGSWSIIWSSDVIMY